MKYYPNLKEKIVMLTELKTYVCDQKPTDEEILKLIDISKKNHCGIEVLYPNYIRPIIISTNSTLEAVKKHYYKYENQNT
jgi:hypothetical protein